MRHVVRPQTGRRRYERTLGGCWAGFAAAVSWPGRHDPAAPPGGSEAINNPGDFGIGKGLTNLPALREVGFSANRRLLGVQRLSHNPIRAADAFTAVHEPIITATGYRIAGLRLGDRRAHALLQALLVFRLLIPSGFTNRDLRELLTGLLGKHPDQISAGQVSYDLRRLARPRPDHPHPRHPPLPAHRHRRRSRHAPHPHPHPAPAARPGPAHRPRPRPRARCAPPPATTNVPSISSPRRPDSPHNKLTRSHRLRRP